MDTMSVAMPKYFRVYPLKNNEEGKKSLKILFANRDVLIAFH